MCHLHPVSFLERSGAVQGGEESGGNYSLVVETAPLPWRKGSPRKKGKSPVMGGLLAPSRVSWRRGFLFLANREKGLILHLGGSPSCGLVVGTATVGGGGGSRAWQREEKKKRIM